MALITQETCFVFNGIPFATELEAVEAGIQNVGTNLLKMHSSDLGAGLLARRDDLLELLTRHAQLEDETGGL